MYPHQEAVTTAEVTTAEMAGEEVILHNYRRKHFRPVYYSYECLRKIFRHSSRYWSFDSSVQWSVSNIVGGTAANGLIDNMGNYCAPAQVPTANPVSVKATASADSSKSDSEQLQILATNPVISSISPQPATAGDQITITGDNFQAPLTALFSNSAGGTIRTAPVQITGSTSIKCLYHKGQ